MVYKVNFSVKEELKHTIMNIKETRYYYSRNFPRTKYSLSDIIDVIFHILKTGSQWQSIKNKSSYYHHFSRFVAFNIFEKTYHRIIKKYILTNDTNIHMIDTTTIFNRNGIERIGRNKYYRNKNTTKISSIVDINGITLSVLLTKGNDHDVKYSYDTVDRIIFVKKQPTKKYFLADKGYDCDNFHKYLEKKKYKPLIAKNIRNIKDKNKIKKFNDEEEKIYKKRHIIENSYSWLKGYKRINLREEKKEKYFINFIYFAMINILIRKYDKRLIANS